MKACAADALERGIQIFNERGIKRVSGRIYTKDKNGNECGCALLALAFGLGLPVEDLAKEIEDGVSGDSVFFEVIPEACPILQVRGANSLMPSRILLDEIWAMNDTWDKEALGYKFKYSFQDILERIRKLEPIALEIAVNQEEE